MSTTYRQNRSAVFSLQYHLVWCTKYRREVLNNKVSIRLKQLLKIQAKKLNSKILAIEIMPDHVHVFVSSDPTRSVCELVHCLKGGTSARLREEFRHLRSRIPTLWTRSYYAGTAGDISSDVIKKYINNQKGI